MPTDLPAWFGKVALAESVTAAVLILVSRASSAQAPEDPAMLLADLANESVLLRDDADPTGETFHLVPNVQAAMLERLSQLPGGIHEVREGLLREGLASAPLPLVGQLTIWAHGNANWATLTELWLKYSPAVWASVAQNAVGVFSDVPVEARKAHPALTQAAAMTAALDPARAWTFSEQAVGKVRQDGRLLHSGWASLTDVDSCLRAGSMWMVAQRTMAGPSDQLEEAWETHDALAALIKAQTRAGNSPTSSAQTFFHAMSASTALLRGDLYQARLDCEQAMMLSQPGDVSALIGAGLEALTLIIAGNVHGFERADEWFDANAPACGVFAAVATPYLELARSLEAIRLLDRETAAVSLQLASALEQGSEFWSAFAWISSLHDLTWREPEYGLAKLEAAVASNPSSGEHESLSEALATRARADLLCGAGRINQARALLKASAHSKLRRYRLVAEARMHLCGQDGAAAVQVAEEGVFDPAIHFPDRAHLYAIKSAGLLLSGADPKLVWAALDAACTLCTEAANLLPFVFLPPNLRAGLLELHDQVGHSSSCVLDSEDLRERLAQVRDNFGASPALIRLTPREEILLPLLATTATVHEIARQLQVSVNTVRKQVVTLREKLAAPDRASMISKAFELGLLAGREPQG